MARLRAAGTTWVVAVSGGSDSVGLLRVLASAGARSWACALGGPPRPRGRGARRRGPTRRSWRTWPARSACPSTWATGGRRGPATSRPTPAAPATPGCVEVAARPGRGGRGRRPHARRPGRDDPPPDPPRHRATRTRRACPAGGVAEPGAAVALVRPLLEVSRQEIRDDLAALGQPFREDASNADPSRTRRRIRHDLLPRLAAEYNPRVAEALVRLGTLAGDCPSGLMERLAGRAGARRDRGRRSATGSSSAATGCSRLPVFLRAEVLRRAWREAGWPEAGMSAAAMAAAGRLARPAGGPRAARRWRDRAVDDRHRGIARRRLRPATHRPGRSNRTARRPCSRRSPIDVPGAVAWGAGRIVTVLEPECPCDETIDLDRVALPLSVRAPVPGDRFAPLGMGGREHAAQ